VRSFFIKAQVAAIIGSIADYLTTIFLVEIFHCWYLLANFLGNITGGSIQFLLNRQWVFKAETGRVYIQIIRFILVFAGNLVLSAAGVYILTSWLRINYLISKTVVSILLGVTYNYLMQKKFVFSTKTYHKI
jgi:putative flippase GtrA